VGLGGGDQDILPGQTMLHLATSSCGAAFRDSATLRSAFHCATQMWVIKGPVGRLRIGGRNRRRGPRFDSRSRMSSTAACPPRSRKPSTGKSARCSSNTSSKVIPRAVGFAPTWGRPFRVIKNREGTRISDEERASSHRRGMLTCSRPRRGRLGSRESIGFPRAPRSAPAATGRPGKNLSLSLFLLTLNPAVCFAAKERKERKAKPFHRLSNRFRVTFLVVTIQWWLRA